MNNYLKKLYRKYISLDDIHIDISKDKIQESFYNQKNESGWTFFSERAFIEELFCTRFNYFIATVSLLSAAITQIKSIHILFYVVLVSLIIIILMAFNIYRAYVKMIILLKILYQLDDFNALNIVDKEVKRAENKLSFSTNHLIGFIIPFICILSYFTILICIIIKISSPMILNMIHKILLIYEG